MADHCWSWKAAARRSRLSLGWLGWPPNTGPLHPAAAPSFPRREAPVGGALNDTKKKSNEATPYDPFKREWLRLGEVINLARGASMDLKIDWPPEEEEWLEAFKELKAAVEHGELLVGSLLDAQRPTRNTSASVENLWRFASARGDRWQWLLVLCKRCGDPQRSRRPSACGARTRSSPAAVGRSSAFARRPVARIFTMSPIGGSCGPSKKEMCRSRPSGMRLAQH